MIYADFDKLKKTAAGKSPFPHLLCPEFVRPDGLDAIQKAFPTVPAGGSFPLSTLTYGDDFAALIEDIRSAEMAEILAEKLDAPITKKPTMITVRGFCRPGDGKIHLDSGGKLVTVLLYLNTDWDEKSGGRLRLLMNGDDLDDYFLETPPGNGTLLAFRCDKNAWHGHQSFSGERKAIQLNWVESTAYRRREAARHFVSATIKKTRAVFRSGDAT